MSDDYQRRSYGDTPVGFGQKPGIVVVDFMVAFTDPQYPLGGAPLVLRAFENTVSSWRSRAATTCRSPPATPPT